MSPASSEQIKTSLATGIRMLEHAGLLDMNGHLSWRPPGTETMMINSRRASRATVTADDIVTVSLDGELLEGADEPPSEFHIHASIYRSRPDVSSVLHSHPHWQTVLGIAHIPMEPVFSIGSFADPTSPVFEISSLVNTREIGDDLAQVLGNAGYALMRHHGAVIAEQSIEGTFARAVLVEENAQKQYQAAVLGKAHPMTGENLARTRETNWTPKIARKIWDYHYEKAAVAGALDGLR